MPGGDRTGPRGMGPLSGRAAGRCAGFDIPEFFNRAVGRGFGPGYGRPHGMSWGRGRGWRHMYWATGLPGRLRSGRYFDREEKIDPDFEKQSLKDQESILQSELDTIKKRLGELETPDQNA